MDEIEKVKQQEVDERSRPFIAVREFWTEYVTKDGQPVEEDWVSWVKKGQSIPDEYRSKIKYMPKYYCLEWTLIGPRYEAWKKGQTVISDGTPLGAWPGSDKNLIKILETVNIRTLEDFCDMEDSALSRLASPGMRAKQREARMFREAQKNAAPQVEKLMKLEDENGILRSEIEDMRKQIEQLVAVDQTEKRGPGRPRKEPDAA